MKDDDAAVDDTADTTEKKAINSEAKDHVAASQSEKDKAAGG
jgi:hypothetical protein